MGRIVGIDLGTTNSVVATVDRGKPKVLHNRNRKSMTPSIISLKKAKKHGPKSAAETLFGEAAVKNLPITPQDTIVSIKRLMGRGVDDEEVQKVRLWADYSIVEPSDGTRDSVRIIMGGKEYSPTEISAKILRGLKEEAEIRLQAEVTHAVITVPAYFSQIQRAATRNAGMMAGLRIIKISEEPTSAAIAYGIDTEAGSTPRNLLVYDLGGGTFDVSVLMWAGGIFVPLALEGDMWLGGDDFDKLIVERFLEGIDSQHGLDDLRENKVFMASLKSAAEKAKKSLSSGQSENIVVDVMLPEAAGKPIKIEHLELTRSEFEEMISPLVDKTIDIVRKAIESAPVESTDEIDHVLMVGQSTYIPLIQKKLEELFGAEKIRRDIHPKECVAIGAAILANRLGGSVCQAQNSIDRSRECGHVNDLNAVTCERCGAPLNAGNRVGTQGDTSFGRFPPPPGIAPFAYGTQTTGDVFNIFVHKGDAYPTENPQPQTFYTSRPNQRMISIPVHGGDNLERASANEKQGEAFTVLPPNLPKGSVVRVALWLDNDGCFRVAAHLDDGTDLDPWITEGGEDAKAIEAMQRVREKLVSKENLLAIEVTVEVESLMKRALEELRKHRFSDALVLACQAEDLVDQEETLAERAERLIWNAKHVAQEYSWAMDSNRSLELSNLADEARDAQMAKRMNILEDKVDSLDKILDEVPQIVKLLLGLKVVIFERIHPIDPTLARSLLNDVEIVEDGMQSSGSAGEEKVDKIAEKVFRDVCRIEADSLKEYRCSVCSELLQGKRYCPNCKHDQFVLDGRKRYLAGDIKRKQSE